MTYFPVVIETQYAALMSIGGQRAPGFFAVTGLASLLLIGASALRWLLLPRCTFELGPRVRMLCDSSARIALRASIVALCATLFSTAVWLMLGGHREFIYFQF